MRNVIVTGGSRGIGLGIARRLVAAGYRVAAVARGETKELRSAIAELNRDGAEALHFLPCDLGDLKAVPELVRTARKRLGPIWGLVNNAAIGTEGLLATMHNSQIEELVRLNTIAPIVLTKYAVRAMMAQGSGRIVNIASIIGFTGYNALSVYGATKASMIGFTRSLAREVGRLDITVNAVAPGFIETRLTEGLGDAGRDKIAGRSALRRLAQVEDVAAAVEYLMGESGRNVTGTVLTVDAGSTA